MGTTGESRAPALLIDSQRACVAAHLLGPAGWWPSFVCTGAESQVAAGGLDAPSGHCVNTVRPTFNLCATAAGAADPP